MVFIKQWIICILIGAFIVNIVDMILPKSKLKPYINLVCNFIFIFIVISPIVGFLSKGTSLEDKILKSMNDYNKKYLESSTDLSNGNKKIDLNKEYESSLKDVIKLKLEESGYELEDIDINGSDIESLKIKENKSDEKDDKNKEKGKDDTNKASEVFENKTTDKNQEKIKDDLIKILDVSVDKIEID